MVCDIRCGIIKKSLSVPFNIGTSLSIMFCDSLGVLVVLVHVIALCTCPGATALDLELQSCSHVADTFNSLDLADGGRESVLSRHSIYEELQQGI